MAHKICNLIKVFGKGAITFAGSCKCSKHLLSFTTDLDFRGFPLAEDVISPQKASSLRRKLLGQCESKDLRKRSCKVTDFDGISILIFSKDSDNLVFHASKNPWLLISCASSSFVL